jgi:hypothetical protein
MDSGARVDYHLGASSAWGGRRETSNGPESFLSEDLAGRHHRVLLVIGTRPEAIKMAPVFAALRDLDDIETRLALTGQHTTLVDQVLEVCMTWPTAVSTA